MTKIPIMATIINTPLSSSSSLLSLSSASTSTSTSSKNSNEKKKEQLPKQEENDKGEEGKEKVWWTALAEGLFHHLYIQQQEGHRINYLPAYFAVPSSIFPSTSTSTSASSIDTAIITSCVKPHVTNDDDNDTHTHTHTHLDNDHPDSSPSISSSSPVITKLDIVTPLNHQNYQQILNNQHQHQHQHQHQ
eukprot:CAMPEP_0171008544 /NCGR_PEP_ID=MMETSP0736-20130129/20648_1 /TAXON_ID=186038 /ORGANISM="Fragilariopsis kerguelensis, Strain L26-C5" /LENGTH=189 /DNA_ID=CAMNT_0011439705 /DNA_START=100 /DNA_END=666 /DNA_ORIENTATION=+